MISWVIDISFIEFVEGLELISRKEQVFLEDCKDQGLRFCKMEHPSGKTSRKRATFTVNALTNIWCLIGSAVAS